MTFATSASPTAPDIDPVSDAAFYAPSADTNPPVWEIARPARAVPPQARLGEVAELLRSGPYRAVPVVEVPHPGATPYLLGMVTERGAARVLLAAHTPEARAQARALPVSALLEPVQTWVLGAMRAQEAESLFDASGEDTLPVADQDADGRLRYFGLLSRSDLVQELVRPFKPPTIGGLATPTGVYLTTGTVSGGSGMWALVGSGLTLWAAHLVSSAALLPLETWAEQTGGLSRAVFGSEAVALLLTLSLYLLLVRLSPIAGYHAAEHQVVHAIERGEPLLVGNVRAMPRVHPRCGTNLVAGLVLLTLGGSLLSPLLDRFLPPALDGLGWAIAGVAALSSWRTVGSWLQQYVTTRPASDAQIESGIRAAREVLHRYGRTPYQPEKPLRRMWRLGFLQMMGGYLIGYAVLAALLALFPALNHVLGPWLPLHNLL